MNDYLEKFEAPSSWRDLVPGAAILIVAVIAIATLEATVEPEVVQPKISQQAEAPSGLALRLPMSHPLGCPEEDEAGRPLRATLSIKGEKRPRCYYKPVEWK